MHLPPTKICILMFYASLIKKYWCETIFINNIILFENKSFYHLPQTPQSTFIVNMSAVLLIILLLMRKSRFLLDL